MTEDWTIVDPPRSLGRWPEVSEAGTLLQMDDGRVLLVGHLNTLGGVCDDCREYGKVIAYKKLSIPELERRVRRSVGNQIQVPMWAPNQS